MPKLRALWARSKHRLVRSNAIQAFSKNRPSGEAVLGDLLAAPEEPQRQHIEAKLAKK